MHSKDVEYTQETASTAATATAIRERVARKIQGELIPRLMLAHASGDLAARQPTLRHLPPSRDDVAELARLLSLSSERPAEVFLEVVRGRSVAVGELCLELFAPAARLLGDLWLDDTITWSEVTIGLTRLHQMVRRLSHEQERLRRDVVGRAVLALAPQEQHCLGVCILEQFLASAGWDTCTVLSTSHPDCVRFLEDEHFDVIGFSLSRDDALEPLGRLIEQVRRVSLNPKVGVVVGGRTFNDNPGFVRQVGADGVATDAAAAVELFDRFRSPRRSGSSA